MTNRKDKNTQQLVELIKSRNSEKFDEFLEEHKPFEDCFYLSYKSQPLIYIAIKAENENAAIKLINEIKVFNKEHLNRKYNNKTFLHYAISDNLLSVGEALIEAGVDPNLQNCQGETALHIADRCGHYDIVKKLIEAGAYLYIRDNSGKMELDLAYKYRNLNIKALLKETEEKRRTSATVCQIQLIDLPTNNEDTSLSESNDLLTKVIQNTILNDDQISEKENNSELEEFVSNLSSEKKDMLDMCVDSAYSSLTDVSMSANNNRENDSEKPPFHYKKNLLSRHCKQSEPIDLSTSTEYTSSEYQTQPLDLSTSNANNKRPCADIDKQNDNATNKIRRTEIHQKVEPSTSLSFTGEPNILLVCEDSRMIK